MSSVDFSILTLDETRMLARQEGFQIPRSAPTRKEDLQAFIIQKASANVISALTVFAREKEERRSSYQSRARVEEAGGGRPGVRRRVEEYRPVKARHTYDQSKYLDLPTADEVKACYRHFYEATSDNALKMVICAVCAREVGVFDDNVSVLSPQEIPNGHRLVPHQPHPAHHLLNGMLLEPSGVQYHDEPARQKVNICHQCRSSLEHNESNVPPGISLANNMWIGPIPEVLSSLTFPEQLLISHLYPRVYVFKLYPKKGFGGDPSKLQSGMRGSVSTFEFDMRGITSMLEGNLMPRRPALLASIISVTYIGLGRLSKHWLRHLFRVRRRRVLLALEWLKENNTRYYGQVTIDRSSLESLPEDDIPVELISIVRQSTDVQIVDQESAGYVPDHGEDEDFRGDDGHEKIAELYGANGYDESDDENMDRQELEDECNSDDPVVIPLEVNGSVDVDLTSLSASELMSWGLVNLWSEGGEGAYAVRHGRRPVGDFGRPQRGEAFDPERDNFFEKAFPCLFPYGRGGIEGDRVVGVSFSEHVRWALQYHDRRFRCHESFPFVSFGILQRRQALLSARLQMRGPQFEREARMIATITAAKLQKACEEEDRGLPISDPVVRLLQRSVYATASRVQGSNQQRVGLRGQMWSTCIMKNPATLWITINPSDLHDPIAQVFAGEAINLDAFMSTIGPDRDKRARNIAGDPYAAAKFFHFIIRTMLETLFGVKISDYQVQNKVGIFGRVSVYFGVVETQGRGTLHFHLLLWLEDAPSAEEILVLLKSEVFRSKVADYIGQNLRAYVPGLENAESIKAIPRQKDIAFNRPINPDALDYDEQLEDFELRLARCEQIHTCRLRQCLVQDKNGTYRCKRRAPFQLSDIDDIDENGNWCQKRLYGYVNGWIPGILVNGRCNNDGKLLTNGSDTKKVARYTTTYAAKKQGRSYNASAVMAKSYAYHLDHLEGNGESESYLDGIRNTQRLLLFRLVHSLNREQEIAGPMVISYLMGWGDAYRSHHYSPVYWTSFVHALLHEFPSLQFSQSSQVKLLESMSPRQESEGSILERGETQSVETAEIDNHSITIDMSSQGTVCAKSQVIDYRARGVELESYNVVSFYMDTYERKILPGDQFEDEDERLTSVKRGRPRNDRVRYLSDHPKAKTVLRIIRSKVHNNLPNFIGRRFPRGDDPDTYDFYCASMLMLLKPWRDLNRDLKRSGETWAESFAAFRETAASLEDQAILSGIAYLHDCETAASKDQSKHDMTEGREERYEDEEELEDQDEGADEDMETSGRILTEDGLEAIIRAQTSLEEEVHARLAIELAKRAKIFQNEGEGDAWEAWDRQTVVGNATGDDLHRLARWRNQLETEVAKINESSRMGDVQKDLGGPQCVESGVVRPINVDSNAASEVLRVEVMNVCNSTRHNDETYDVLSAADPSDLNIDQRRAYDIIIWHLEQTLAGNEPPPLRMIIHGEGGTGKSKVLQTVTQTFKDRGCQNMLLKAAYTGVAASVIEGKTTHVIGGISAAVSRYDANEAVADETKVKLEKFWEQYKYLALDEMSMLAKDFFALLSRNAGIGKGNIDGRSFGGVNVIILGDFHQFPPVARPIRDALYYPSNAETDSLGSQIGRAIYEEFTMVVTLKEQKRVTDPVWHDFLRNLRTGSVNAGHVQMLRSLIIGEKSSDNVDFESEPWNDASLVTPRHAVRVHWNNAALRKMCREKGQSIFICRAEDTIRGRSIGLRERYALESHRGNSKRNRGSRTSKDLPYQIEIAIGMKVMVTNNVETDLDITNGARGVIVDIVLHPDEPPINRNDAVIRLKYLPSYLLVKLTRTRATRLEGLDECVIPIESGTTSYRIKIMVGGKMVQRTVKRKQYPLTAAYGFTDYRSQGQTIPYVIVDIAMPPTGGLNLFNLYVALSRSSGRNTIRLLRNFDDKLFEKQHDGALLQEDERLEALDRQTVQWYERVIQAHQSQP